MRSDRDVAREVLEIFAEAQRRIERRVATEEGGLEALRRAYRERQKAKGLCVSCPEHADAGSVYCARHRREAGRRGMSWHEANRERSLENMRERRRRLKAAT